MFDVIVNQKIAKKVKSLPPSERKKIAKVILALRISPLPRDHDIKKIRGDKEDSWRIRIGDLRIIYYFSTENEVVKITKIDFRGNVY